VSQGLLVKDPLPPLPRDSTIDLPTSLKEDSQLAVSYKDSLQQTILNAREAAKALDEYTSVLPDPTEFLKQVDEVRDIVKANNMRKKAPRYKDITVLESQLKDIYRTTEKVFGEDFAAIKKGILDPFDASKGAYIDDLNVNLDDLKATVVKDLGIKKGSRESQWVQLFGEKQKTYTDLVKKFGVTKADNIVKADQWFRAKYDELMGRVNKVEQEIYPYNPEKWTPTRTDYYRHFSDMSSDFSRLQNILDNPIKIDPMLVGISEGTKPKSKWASFKQERLGIKTDEDAVGGFLDYLPSATYAVHIDPHIGKFRELGDILARSTRKEKNLNNYIGNLEDFANSLAGKTHIWDRAFQKTVPGGRQALQGVSWLNSRVKANTILGNAASSIAQIFNVPQGIASAGKINSAGAIKDSLAQIFIKNPEMAKSTFLKERYFRGFNKFDQGILNNTRKFAVWMVNALDEVGTRFIWLAEYRKANELGIKNPVNYADNAARKAVAGRGIGEKPLLQSAKTFQVIAPFQLEVTNLWWAMQDLAKTNPGILAKFDKFATLFVSLYLLNRAAEEIRGSSVALDPIQATIDAVGEVIERPSAEGVLRGGGRLAGEVLSNVPLGQTVASLYPQFGFNVGDTKLPTRSELFGREDPTRFGGGLLSTKALQDPLYKILPPFGGSQIKKTIGGAQALLAGRSEDRSGRPQFDVGGSLLKNLQALTFGKYSGSEAREFFDEDVSFAEATLKKLQESPTGKQDLQKLVEEDPALVEQIIRVLKKQASGITEDEERIKNLGVANGARAKKVAKQLNKLKTKEEKLELVQHYVELKIITKDVAEQLVPLLK
jgi:hypothetical protein